MPATLATQAIGQTSARRRQGGRYAADKIRASGRATCAFTSNGGRNLFVIAVWPSHREGNSARQKRRTTIFNGGGRDLLGHGSSQIDAERRGLLSVLGNCRHHSRRQDDDVATRTGNFRRSGLVVQLKSTESDQFVELPAVPTIAGARIGNDD